MSGSLRVVGAAAADAAEKAARAEIPTVMEVDEAEALIRRVTMAADAVRLQKLGQERIRHWQGLELRAERRWGELLGPAKLGRKRIDAADVNFSRSERDARNKARKVAEVPAKAFEKYLATADNPSRAGLLRSVAPPREPAAKPTTKKEKKPKSPPRSRSFTGKTPKMREREVRAAMRDTDTGLIHLMQFSLALSKAVVVLESYDPADLSLEDVVMWHTTDVLDDLISLGEWWMRTIMSVRAFMGDSKILTKIAKLRNVEGRTPEEAESALRLADEIERKLKMDLEGRK